MNQPATIIIVDDAAANRETLVALLEGPEFRLVEATDGIEALRLAVESPPDLILLDVMMPGMDGFEVCRRLRADARLAEVPVIMITALDDQASRLAGLEAGADDFTAKPFNRAELRARVRTITRLNRYRGLHEQREQFRWVVEQASDGYILTNPADEVVFANSRARLWLGLPAESTAPAGRETFLAIVRRSFTCEPAGYWQDWPDGLSDGFDAPLLLVHAESPTGPAFFLEVSIRTSPGGRLLRLTDVTERLAARRDQRSFQAMVEHKLRTPLNALHGGLELLADFESLGPREIAEFTGMARAGAARLVGAVEDVLRFASLSRLARPLAGFPANRLGELVQTVATSLALPPVSVDLGGGARQASLACAAETLEWILYELLGNAKKFHPQGRPMVRVELTENGADGVCLSVSDDGSTLSPGQLAHAGTPYYQGEKHFTGEVPGLGLGLAAVSTALWQAGGSCRLRNRSDGPGVCVELKWPSLSPEVRPVDPTLAKTINHET